ncbi:OprD family porin [Sneathiella marina]|uniref:OprD family porin n=1 Tax=Sneathiella marina TaxID=2950108 RepID=A0ABY4W1H2_9PROT|nr:OprD family outer membrane porin [Sneathiella marina]USG59687.1 OprD family porin [Sneathiella marina]
MADKKSKKQLTSHRLATAFLLPSILIFPAQMTFAADVGEFEIKLKTYYFNRDKDQDNPDSVAFTQGLMLYYNSPYLNDFVNLNAAGFANLKLVGESGKGGSGLLQVQPDGSQTSYAKLGELNLDFKLPKNGNLIIGRKQLTYPLKNDINNRATPAASQAAVLTYDIGGTTLYALASDRGSPKTVTKFNKYQDNNGDDFIVYIAGAKHEFENSLFIEASAGHADNVMNRAYLDVQYPITLNDDYTLKLDAHQYFGWADGEGAVANVGSDYYSSLTSLVGHLSAHNARFTLGFQNVSGDSHQVSWDGGVNDENSYKTWHSVTRLDFDRGGERTYIVRLDYDLKDFIEGLTSMVRYTSGHNIKRNDGQRGSEWERDFVLTYRPPMLPDLSFSWINGYVKSSETYNSVENRIIVNYAIKY